MPRRREFEIAAPGQIGIGAEKRRGIDAWNQQEQKRQGIDDERHGGKFHRQPERIPEGKGAARGFARSELQLDSFRQFVEEIAGDDEGYRRH